MNTSSPAPGASLLPDSTSLITSVHFILIALFALAVVAMIVVGIVRKRRRKQADAALEERVEEAAQTRPEPTVPAPPVTIASPADAPAFALTQLKGLGPKVAARLEELGIATVPQLAALSDDEAAGVDAQLGSFAGRLTRDRWVEQARLLSAGDRAGFEARFGKL